MATFFRLLLLLFFFSDSLVSIRSVGVGINYGQIANNLPPPSRVVSLLRSLNITRVKLYDANPNILSAFASSDVEFILGLGNEYLQAMTDPTQAQTWIKQHVQPYISQTKIKCITVGNEVLTGNNAQLISYLLPAMKTIQEALTNLGLDREIYVTTAHSFGVLSNSFPPSAGTFRQDLAQNIDSILDFHSQTGSPFLINAYPFFAYKDNAEQVSLNYVLFQPNSGTVDPSTNLKYDNMLYAQIDAVYSAIKALGHTDVQVQVSETGWPSKGDPDEVGATLQNAKIYNGNLLKRIEQGQGTPAKPLVPIDIYVFALFNENLKPGPLSERNYGLLYPDGNPVYDIGIQGPQGSQGSQGLPGYLPMMVFSASNNNVACFLNLLLFWIAHYMFFRVQYSFH